MPDPAPIPYARPADPGFPPPPRPPASRRTVIACTAVVVIVVIVAAGALLRSWNRADDIARATAAANQAAAELAEKEAQARERIHFYQASGATQSAVDVEINHLCDVYRNERQLAYTRDRLLGKDVYPASEGLFAGYKKRWGEWAAAEKAAGPGGTR